MHLIYHALGFGPGDEVIVPSQTHVATAHAVELSGARPVFVDANIHSGNIDVEAIEALISPRTKALAVVHYLGVPADMEKISEIAKKHGLFLLEDCALSPGASFSGVHTGLIGDARCFSFYPVKHDCRRWHDNPQGSGTSRKIGLLGVWGQSNAEKKRSWNTMWST